MLKYSIVMPVYNTGEKLHKSIESIINQTYSNWELIVVNDGSTDNSLDIIEKYAVNEERIKIINQKNQGPGVARNNGIKECTGDYIAFLDSDDYYDLKFLELINNENRKEKQDIIYIGDVKEYTNGKKFGGYSFAKYKNKTKDELLRIQIMGTIPWGGVLKVVKKEIVNGSNYSNLEVGEELIYSINVLMKSEKIKFLDQLLYHYVYNENGQHTHGGFNPWNEVTSGLKKFLIENNLYLKYQKELNGLALKALSICIYRYSCCYSFFKAKKYFKDIIKEYNNNYDLNNTNYKMLDKTSKIILKLVNLKFYFTLYILSKIKKIKSKG